MKITTMSWMAKHPDGRLMIHTCAWRRKGAAERIIGSFSVPPKWELMYKAGWRIVRVSIREV